MESPPLLHLLDNGEDAGDEETLTALAGCMEKLPERQKETVTMFFIEKRSYAEIADTTLYDIKGVKSYIQNGKRNLKTCLERHGVSL